MVASPIRSVGCINVSLAEIITTAEHMLRTYVRVDRAAVASSYLGGLKGGSLERSALADGNGGLDNNAEWVGFGMRLLGWKGSGRRTPLSSRFCNYVR